MHCPNCGQQQASDAIKFCSRCGLPLSLIAEVVAQGGYLSQLADARGSKAWLTRKNGIKASVVWALLLFLVTALAAVGDGGDAVPVLGVLWLFGTMLIIAFSLMFLPKAQQKLGFQEDSQDVQGYPNYLAGNRSAGALPPQTSQPVENYVPPAHSWRTPDTGEFARPGSVTESTTKLLSKEE